MKDTTRFIIDWISRMAQTYGGSVYTKEGKCLDWGQAICYEQYGKDWNKYLDDNDIEDPDEESLRLAKKWESGEHPDWVDVSRLNKRD